MIFYALVAQFLFPNYIFSLFPVSPKMYFFHKYHLPNSIKRRIQRTKHHNKNKNYNEIFEMPLFGSGIRDVLGYSFLKRKVKNENYAAGT
jgi:hypothetical protein